MKTVSSMNVIPVMKTISSMNVIPVMKTISSMKSNRVIKRFLNFIIILLAVLPAGAGEKEIPPLVEHLDVKDGLLNGFITDLTQDNRGFLWIATDAGLNRFDGENFKAFTEKNTRLSGNAINALLYQPETDQLWIASKKGLSVLNCASQTFEEIKLPDKFLNKNIINLRRSNDGGIWLLFHYDYILHYKDGVFTPYTTKELPGLPMCFKSIVQNKDGRLYIGHAEYGFSVVDPKTKKIENYRHDPADPRSLPSNSVSCILIDRYNNIWLGTEHGLSLFNPLTRHFTNFLPSLNIFSLEELHDGTLWIGSDVGGVNMLDIRDLTFANPDRLQFMSVPVSEGPHSISSNSVRSIFQDSFNNIWIGNYGAGLDYIRSSDPPFEVLSDFAGDNAREAAFSVCRAKDGGIWVGGENCIALVRDGKVRKRYDLSAYSQGSGSRVFALTEYGDALVFSLQDGGMKRLDLNTGKVESLSAMNARKEEDCLYVTPDGRLLAGTFNGLYELKGSEFVKNTEISRQFNNLVVNGLTIDKQGKLWVGTYGDGVFVFAPNGKLTAHLQSEKGFASNAVKQLLRDSRGWVWIAGQDGLSVVKDTSKPLEFTNFGYDSGLEDIHIRAIVEDPVGDMWFSSNNGLLKWDKDTGKFANYDYRNGLPLSNYLDRAAVCDSAGKLYFGSLKGICNFKPSLMGQEPTRIPVTISECLNVVTPDRMISIGGHEVAPHITVPYSDNSLRIVFSVPDISKSRLVEYSYMIEGVDKEWISAGREHSATLWNLAPGSYVFKVRARMRNQQWSEANVATLKITVTPPFWLSWYAKLIYLLIFGALIYYVIRFYKHRLMLKSSLEMERRKSIDEQELNNERLRFYTNITHELRTPLTLIIGPLEDIISDRNFPKDYKGKINTIHESAQSLLNLINQILEFRKTETQNRRLIVAKGNLSKTVTEIGLRYKELNRNKKVSVILEIEEDIKDLYFDRDIIYTVISNLLSNAMKYTPEGTITLSLRRVPAADGNRIEISVADTGYGIDQKALPHIFDRYYQAEGKHQASGTGIGLALVRSLSDLHKGELTVNSVVGKGTIFTFSILEGNTYPGALHREVTEPEDVPVNEPEQTETEADKRPVVLIVEDNDDIREYIESSLASQYQVFTAGNGEEGLEAALTRIPDIIISDVMMPVMDGMELCRRIKGDVRTSHIPVILLTAKDTLQDKEEGYEIGADSYITKPFSAKLLTNRINNILESRRLLASRISDRIGALPPAVAEITTIAVQMTENEGALTQTARGEAPSAGTKQPEGAAGSASQEAAGTSQNAGTTTGSETVSEAENKEEKKAKAENAGQPPLKLSKLDEAFLQKFTTIVEDNLASDSLDMPFMQEAMNMSHSTLYRKIKGLTGMSGNEFIRKIRLQRGYKMLQEGYNISEATYSCGFNDVGYFRNCFKAQYGLSPTQFLKENSGSGK